VGEFTARISDKSPGGLPKVLKEKYKMYTPKIPRDIYLQIQSFFYDIADEMQDAEAYIELYWDTKETKYVIHVPKQIVSKGSVRYDKDSDLFLHDFERYIAVMQIHSHNTMNAFFSSVDDADEKETKFYGVFGKIKDPEPEFKCRFVVLGEKLNIQANTIFDMAPVKVEYPLEWRDNVKKVGESTGLSHLDQTSNWQNFQSGKSTRNESASYPDGLPPYVHEFMGGQTWDGGVSDDGPQDDYSDYPGAGTSFSPAEEAYWDSVAASRAKREAKEKEVQQTIGKFRKHGSPKIEGIKDCILDLKAFDKLEDRDMVMEEFVKHIDHPDLDSLCEHLEAYGYGRKVAERLRKG
jgi:PRTRC genetic system protein A